jgi:transcriptional antiterminator RfaH
VVYTHPQAEQLACDNLRAQGFVAFLPLLRERRPHRHIRIAPLFPRYVFVSFDPDTAQWGSIWFTRGVKSLLRSAAYEPAQVPDGVIEALMERVGPDGVLDEHADLPQLMTGQRVRVIDGPLAEREGVAVWSTKRRVRLLLSVLAGRAVPVELDREQVVGVDHA